jgi:adenosyl cobinamide kinase/adenosyl cobinamide phosphate guanylyltransferase
VHVRVRVHQRRRPPRWLTRHAQEMGSSEDAPRYSTER